MKCPYCGETVTSPFGRDVNATVSHRGMDVIMLYCPHCKAILGAVNKPKD